MESQGSTTPNANMMSDFTKEEKDENVVNANTLTQENFERHLAAMAAAAAAAAAHGSTTGSSRSSSSFLIKDILFPRSKVGTFSQRENLSIFLPLTFYVKLIFGDFEIEKIIKQL